MSQIQRLIDSLCPSGVEHKNLIEVADYSKTKVDASLLDETNFIGVDNLLPNKGGKVDAQYPPNTARLTAYEPGDILLGNIRPYLQKVWLASGAGGCSGDVLSVRINQDFRELLLPEFLYYTLSSNAFFAYSMKHAKGAKMPRGSKEAILKYRFPIPPIEIQRAIVEILDQFTKLEAELEAELEARKKQYEHYRHRLVSISQSGQKFSLGELEDRGVVKLGRGKVISKIALAEKPGDYPVYSSSGMGTGEFGRYGLYMFDDERITWSVDGGGRFFYRHPHKFSVTNVSGWMTVDPSVIRVKYLYYVLTVQWEKQFFDYTRKAHPSVIRNVYEVYIPPLDEQDELVAKLDQFDTLVNDLSSGLPAEIAARRKQYEYYRDQLLTFKELAS